MKTKTIADEFIALGYSFVDAGMKRRDSVFWRFKTVACAAHRAQITGMFGIDFNLGAQLSYVNIDRAGADESCFPPDSIKNLVAGEDAAGVLGKVVQQAE